jgi:hypothetical protein
VPDDDPERGRRFLVEFRSKGREGIAVLYPVADPSGDVYALITTYPRQRQGIMGSMTESHAVFGA